MSVGDIVVSLCGVKFKVTYPIYLAPDFFHKILTIDSREFLQAFYTYLRRYFLLKLT